MNVLHILWWLVKRRPVTHACMHTLTYTHTQSYTLSVIYIKTSRATVMGRWLCHSRTREKQLYGCGYWATDINREGQNNRKPALASVVREEKRDGKEAWMALHLDLQEKLQSKAEQTKTQRRMLHLKKKVSLIWHKQKIKGEEKCNQLTSCEICVTS